MSKKQLPTRTPDGRLWYVLGVSPVPWTAGEVGHARSRDGGHRTYMIKSKDLKIYQDAIREEMERYIVWPLGTEVDILFVFKRSLDEIRRGGKTTARAHQADATNLQKAAEDALHGVLFTNDNQNRVVNSIILEQGPDTDPCLAIGIKITNDEKVRALIPDSILEEIVKVSR